MYSATEIAIFVCSSFLIYIFSLFVIYHTALYKFNFLLLLICSNMPFSFCVHCHTFSCLSTVQNHPHMSIFISVSKHCGSSFLLVCLYQQHLFTWSAYLKMPCYILLSLSVQFNGHFPSGPALAVARMSPFWILLEDPYSCTYSMTNSNQILHGDHTGWEEKNLRVESTMSPALVKIFCDMNADARSVCGSWPSC